jgi:hypothetical protein
MYITPRRIVAFLLLILLLNWLVATAIDQIQLERARSAVERMLYADLPPGTELDVAMGYLEQYRYFPDYLGEANMIDAARGYDQPAFPARVGRLLFIRGYLDSQQRVIRWEVEANRIFIPVP